MSARSLLTKHWLLAIAMLAMLGALEACKPAPARAPQWERRDGVYGEIHGGVDGDLSGVQVRVIDDKAYSQVQFLECQGECRMWMQTTSKRQGEEITFDLFECTGGGGGNREEVVHYVGQFSDGGLVLTEERPRGQRIERRLERQAKPIDMELGVRPSQPCQF